MSDPVVLTRPRSVAVLGEPLKIAFSAAETSVMSWSRRSPMPSRIRVHSCEG